MLSCFDEGNSLSELVEGVVPRRDEVVVLKQYARSFLGTSLSSLLVSLGCDSTIVCGYSTSGCVRATSEYLLLNLSKCEGPGTDLVMQP